MGLFDKLRKKNTDLAIVNEETDLTNTHYVKMPLEELSLMGISLSSLLPQAKTITKTTLNNASGKLYSVVGLEPGDILRKSKDGFTWGSIKKENGALGWAKFQEVNPVTTTTTTTVMPVDPAMIIIAIYLYSIDQKLSEISDTGKQILSFLETDKESQIEADVKILLDTLKEYRNNWNNNVYLEAHYKQILDIKRTADKNIIFYQKDIEKKIKNNNLIVVNSNVQASLTALMKNFKYYQMSLYIYSMASFLEIVLLGQGQEMHIKDVKNRIKEYETSYISLHKKCSEFIKKMSGSTVENGVLNLLGDAGNTFGNFLKTIPVIKDGPVDDWIKDGSSSLKNTARKMNAKAITTIDSAADPGVSIFIDKINDIDFMFNRSSKVCFDNKNLYLVA